MSKKVLITGVSGQDGSHMVDYILNNTPYLIYGMTRRLSKPDYSNIKKVLDNPRFKLVTGDLGDSQSIENLIREIQPDYFINFAAQSFVGSSWEIPEQTFDAGAMGVLRCLESIRKYAPNCRYYGAGSSEEFGEVITSPQNESHPFRPQSPYGAAKVAARMLTRVYRKSYDLYAIQGILFNHEGTRRGEEFVTRKITKAIPDIMHCVGLGLDTNPIELGNLDAQRDWSDAEDFVDGVWRMLNQDVFNKDVRPSACQDPKLNKKFFINGLKEYILSSNETHTVREFVEEAFTVASEMVLLEQIYTFKWVGSGLDEKFVINYNEKDFTLVKINPKFYRPAEVNLLYGDSSLARKELGWTPKTSFKELVRKMVENDFDIFYQEE